MYNHGQQFVMIIVNHNMHAVKNYNCWTLFYNTHNVDTREINMPYLVASGLLDPDPDCFVRLLELDVLSWGYIKKTMYHIQRTSSLKFDDAFYKIYWIVKVSMNLSYIRLYLDASMKYKSDFLRDWCIMDTHLHTRVVPKVRRHLLFSSYIQYL